MKRLNAFRSKKDLVIGEIRQAILNGELAPGVRLVIDDLAEKLGVSSIPVREALQQLHADGYIVFEPFIGARVAEIAPESIVEVFTLLEAMEVTSSRMACGRLGPEELAELAAIVTHMDTLTADAEAWSQENRHFHEFICAHAGTQLVADLITKVLDHWDRLHRHFLKEVFVRHLPIAQKQHWQILHAIRTGDADEVESLVRRHNQSALRAYQDYLRRQKSGRRNKGRARWDPALGSERP
jgi:DNA-binding GntR family transcriptional regulator